MKVLLDTHTLLWTVINPSSLSATALRIVDHPAAEIVISAASAWEIGIKVRKGKLARAETFEQKFLETIENLGYQLLSIDASIALRAARLLGPHRDPFDRILAAHALALDIPIVSKDAQLDTFGIRRIW